MLGSPWAVGSGAMSGEVRCQGPQEMRAGTVRGRAGTRRAGRGLGRHGSDETCGASVSAAPLWDRCADDYACGRLCSGQMATLLHVRTCVAPAALSGADQHTQARAAGRRAWCRRAPGRRATARSTSASVFRTATAVDCWRPAACRVEPHLSSLPFYGGVERLSSASTVWACCGSASSPCCCRRTPAGARTVWAEDCVTVCTHA
jgi:hypothetical protein